LHQRRHSERSEESVANFRGLPRRSYLTARNDGGDCLARGHAPLSDALFAGDSCFRRNDGVPFCEPCVSFANFAVEKFNAKNATVFRNGRKEKILLILKILRKSWFRQKVQTKGNKFFK